MNATATATVVADPHLARPRAASDRRHLVLVPAGDAAISGARLGEPVMRLSRFGRLVRALLVAAVLTAGAVAASHALASVFALSAGPGVTVTVQAGDTLSQIAAQRLPDLPIADGVVAIQLANDLSTSQIHAGQALIVPTAIPTD
ncbi:MAG: LysM peptidoglycan-binding domain-containing protein [Micrococcales bacterium]|nr:LysM peptidoglycan-binding domain-containing protein [Micrococcales bacterium]